MTPNRIFTYYENVPGISQFDCLMQINIWREAWNAAGLDAFVLSEWHARQHPDFAELEPKLLALPTVNNPAYEFACYARWLALAHVGGGFMCDTDVFPRQRADHGGCAGFPWPMTGAAMNNLHIYQNHNVCPCFIYASPTTARRVVDACIEGKYGLQQINGQKHNSDQYVLEAIVFAQKDVDPSDVWIETHDLVREYGDAEWLTHPFVHCSNASMTPVQKQPRWKFVKEILEAK